MLCNFIIVITIISLPILFRHCFYFCNSLFCKVFPITSFISKFFFNLLSHLILFFSHSVFNLCGHLFYQAFIFPSNISSTPVFSFIFLLTALLFLFYYYNRICPPKLIIPNSYSELMASTFC